MIGARRSTGCTGWRWGGWQPAPDLGTPATDVPRPRGPEVDPAPEAPRDQDRGEKMKAVVFHGVGDIRLEDVPEPRLEAPTDAIVPITASAICGTDLHMIRGTLPGMQAGTILGHEAAGVVEEIGPDVRNLAVGDRVVVPSTIAC